MLMQIGAKRPSMLLKKYRQTGRMLTMSRHIEFYYFSGTGNTRFVSNYCVQLLYVPVAACEMSMPNNMITSAVESDILRPFFEIIQP